MRDPATGAVIKTIADASVADGAAAMDAAAAAQAEWGRTAPRVRGEILRRAFDLLQERADEFALLMTLEMGKPLAEARGEVAYGGEFLRWFGEEAVRITGRYGPNPENTGRMIVTHLPGRPVVPHHPVELPARDGHPQDRAGDRRGLHLGDQARRAHAAHHPLLREAARGRRTARRAS